jgi:hypothetical protein
MPGGGKLRAGLVVVRVFAGCRTIGFRSVPMVQFGPRSTPGVWLTGTILMGRVPIGMPTEIPASRSKSVGVPAETRSR